MRKTGAGNWNDDLLARAIREGVGHDGRSLFPFMPYSDFRAMSDEDLASIMCICGRCRRRYGALLATTPILATVSPFFIEGTAQTYRTTPLDGACASHTVLPNKSVT